MGRSNVVDISGVLATGRPLTVDAEVDLPAFGSYAFAEPARVHLDIRRIDRGLGIDGEVNAIAVGTCDRCLAEIRRPFSADVDETLASNEAEEGAFAESNVLENGHIDVADLARQVVDSALPMVLLCSEDCPGLCPSCGLALREGSCACRASVER